MTNLTMNIPMFENASNMNARLNVFDNQTAMNSNISDILNCISVFVALVGVVFGSFVANVVRKLGDDDLRSRFVLLSVLICDVILASSNLTEVVYILNFINRDMFQDFLCPFVYVNLLLSTIFSVPLALSLLCLAIDQVIAVFKPLYFRTSNSTKRKYTYGSITFIPMPLISASLVFWTLKVPDALDNCLTLLTAASNFVQYVVVFIVPVAVSTPVIYAVVLWKISRQRCVHSENRLENIQNRRIVVSFLLLSASYFLLWMPTLAYFSVCYYNGDGCWEQHSVDISLVVHILFIMNYVVDPVMCAVRMEPIKQKILQMFRIR